ncbi:hypothetical protein [Chondrinema litorale]|uniref:hypothetical protein n=1 Tax=Chondrinema litorale TaxID=2994555 RepID=UPI00254308B0|nr:hypothetical protein [Chondrinema litorale]UZR93583.1 hypothetical protein OQ292_17160 [Chondrinema litorale]
MKGFLNILRKQPLTFSQIFKKHLLIFCGLIFFAGFTLQAQTGIYINNNDKYTQSAKVDITIKIMDVDSLLISNDPSFPAASWQTVSNHLQWELLPGDGKKEVFLKYKDRDGNISQLIMDRIILDTEAPKNGEVVLNEGNNYLNYLENIIIESTITGADWIIVSENSDFKHARWEPYYQKIKYNFTPGDGERNIYVKFKDHAGNESEVYEDKVTIDTKAPFDAKIEIIHGAIVIDSLTGEKYLNEHNNLVDLKLHVKEGKYMKLANGAAFFGLKWRLYDEKYYDWELGNYKDGRYRVAITYRDIAKNESKVIYDEIIVDTAPPFGGKILINDGDIYIKDPEVELKIWASDARYMMVSNEPDFNGRNWEPFKEKKKWKFSTEDGNKKIYVKFKDVAENESEISSDEIMMDATPPHDAKVILNNGDERTQYAYVNAVVKAEEATFMQVSNRPDFKGEIWKNYHNSPIFITLENSPGSKKVYARFMDDAGNISEAVSSEILIEVKPVSAKIEIDNNAVYCNRSDRNVKLHIFAKEAAQMMVSNTADFSGANWEPYQTEKDWVLEDKDGEKTVYVKFKSETETLSETASDKIILDTTTPIPVKIELNNGIPNTFNQKILVKVEAKEATLMQISEDSTFEEVNWKGYTNRHFNFVLTKVSGTQKVYTRFKDQADNTSGIISAEIKLEINPVFVAIYIDKNAEFCTNPERTVELVINARSASEMMVSNDKDFSSSAWVPYKSKIQWTLSEGEGVKRVYAKFKSKTGIESATKYDDIILDILPPQNTNIQINRGRERTIKPIVEVNVNADDAISMQISKYPDFQKARWLPYSTQPFHYFIGNEGGTHTIYTRFKDISGNISEAKPASVVKEVQPHNGDFVIDNDQPFTTNDNGKVELDIVTVRATEMMISESENFSNSVWQPLEKSVKWNLSGEDGLKTIYMKFRSKTLNESSPIKDQILLDRTPPQNCSIILNNLAWLRYLNPNHIQVKVKADDAFQVQLSEYDNFTGRPWRAYTDKPFPFKLSKTSGEITIYARFKDFYGNISETIQQTITIDEVSPENNTLAINEGKQHTNSTSVTINSYSEGAKEMRLANSSHTLKNAEWKTYQEKVNWELAKSEDNKRIVYMQFKDTYGNTSQVATAVIELDREKPSKPKFEVQDNAHVNHPAGEVNLILQADGATQMMVSNDRSFSDATWETLYPIKKWHLPEGDGPKKVYAKFSDEAGNETEVLELDLVLDRDAPEALSLSINNDDIITAKHEVMLKLAASGADEMIISNNGLFALPHKWMPYNSEKKWRLFGQDGEKTVYVKFRDKAGNESPILTQTITLDTEAPVIYTFEINNGETAVDGTDVNLFLNVKHINGLPDAKFLQLSNSKNFSSANWEPFSNQVSWRMSGNGLQKVYIRLKDEAGNVSVPFEDNITVY